MQASLSTNPRLVLTFVVLTRFITHKKSMDLRHPQKLPFQINKKEKQAARKQTWWLALDPYRRQAICHGLMESKCSNMRYPLASD